MHLPILAGSLRRTRRALLAAGLAAVALPSAAQAGTAQVHTSGHVGYGAAAGEVNNVRVSVVGGKLVISDQVPIVARNGCVLNGMGDAECPISVSSIAVTLGDKDDVIQYAAPHSGVLGGDVGNDTFLGGIRQAAPGHPIEPLLYFGDAGTDTISYRLADRGVRVDTGDSSGNPSLANDGRPGDLEDVPSTIEVIEGSNFADVLFGSNGNDVIRGLNGDDEIGGGAGNDVIDEGSAANGADSIHGGGGNGGIDTVSYSGRSQPVVASLDNVADDGERDEGDDVRSNVENAIGGSAGDVLESVSAASVLNGRGGSDFLFGGRGADTLIGGTGIDNLNAGGENDVVDSRDDGELDTIDCGDQLDTDTLLRDSSERRVDGCEDVELGTLRLVPKQVQTEVGETARMRLSWRHPRAWRKLRTIELRLTRDEMPVGEITIRPRGERITDDGAVTLVRRGTRLMRRGKTVAARLALRLDQSLAGQTLEAEVEATDRRGLRQLERDAGRIRVSG